MMYWPVFNYRISVPLINIYITLHYINILIIKVKIINLSSKEKQKILKNSFRLISEEILKILKFKSMIIISHYSKIFKKYNIFLLYGAFPSSFLI